MDRGVLYARSMGLRLRLGLLLTSLSVSAAVATIAPSDARACGGCFHEPPPPNEVESVITDHRMILSVSPTQTTLYDQIRYTGTPSSFAWVLPIAGAADVGLSSDALFGTLDNLTQTTIQAPPPPACPGPPFQNCPGQYDTAGAAATDAGASFGGHNAPPPVVVTKQEVVGPYETVQLHSTDPMALNTWLTSHGFVVPTDVQPIIDQYVTEHFDFLAMKLVPGANVQAMRPVRVTIVGASPVLPLRMVAAGTGATVGITLWVVGQGNYEPQNFQFFSIDSSELVWDYNTSSSNYTTLRAQKEAALGGAGWQIESAIDVSPSSVSSLLLQSESPNPYCPSCGGGADASADYPPAMDSDGGVTETADQARDADLATLFMGIATDVQNARITRMRSDLAHSALGNDLVITASQNQNPISSTHYVTNTINTPTCPVYGPPPPCPSTGPFGDIPGGSGTSSGSGSESFGCQTTAAPIGEPLALAGGLAALVALTFVRSRRKK
jgi:hypothetical protein